MPNERQDSWLRKRKISIQQRPTTTKEFKVGHYNRSDRQVSDKTEFRVKGSFRTRRRVYLRISFRKYRIQSLFENILKIVFSVFLCILECWNSCQCQCVGSYENSRSTAFRWANRRIKPRTNHSCRTEHGPYRWQASYWGIWNQLILRLHATDCYLVLLVTLNDKPFQSNAVASKSLAYDEKPLASTGGGRRHDFSERLPVGWKNTLEDNDQQWIGQNLFLRSTELAHKLNI